MKATVDGGKMHVFLLRAGPRFIAVILLEDTDESSSILHPPIRFWRRQNQGIVSSRKVLRINQCTLFHSLLITITRIFGRIFHIYLLFFGW